MLLSSEKRFFENTFINDLDMIKNDKIFNDMAK